MRKLVATALMLTQLFASVAQAQTSSPVNVSALQAQAASITQNVLSQSPTFDANGNLAIDPTTGNVQQQRTSKQSMASQGAAFQAITGVQNYQIDANPTNGGSAAAAVTASQHADFNCTTSVGQQKSVGNYVVSLSSCAQSSGTVQSVNVQECSALNSGGTCTASTSFSGLTLSSGSWTALPDNPNAYAGVSCADNVCRITIQSSTSLGGTNASMQTAAQQQVTAQGTNSLSAMQASSANQQTSDQKQQVQAIRDCFVQNQQRLATGQPLLTCDGSSTVSTSSLTASAQSGASCAGGLQCIRQATQSVQYTQSCTKTYPLTEYDCTYTVPTKTCQITVDNTVSPPAQTSSCSATDISGGTKVGSTQGQCDATGANCNTTSWQDYYAFPDQKTQSGQCTTYPSPLAGAPASSCANAGQGNITSCGDGGWFGRTLSDSQCFSNVVVKNADGSTSTSVTNLTNADKAGCGYCALPTYAATCYAQPTANNPADSCSSMPSNCSLTSTTPGASINGMTTSETDTYTCTSSQTSCVQYEQDPTCATNLTQGLATSTTQTVNQQQNLSAFADMAVLDAITKSASTAANPQMPTIFDGTAQGCRQPVGFLSGALLNDCCQINLQRPGGGRPVNSCNDGEVKLAASRRANLSFYVGEYCSKSVGFMGLKHCIEETQSYCMFDGLLDDLIQVQGRQQLTTIVNSGLGSSQNAQMSFPYYSGQGGWGTPVSLNGLTVVPWQYPAYCASAAQTQAALANNPDAMLCPNVLTQWFATCESGSNCGDMPSDPALGSSQWLVQGIDPLKNQLAAIDRFALVNGACDPTSTNCSYQLTAWPPASDGQALVTRSFQWQLFSSAQTAASANIFSLGDYLFEPQPVAGAPSATAPAQLSMSVSPDYGTTWSTVTLPTRTSGDGVVIAGTGVTFSGQCDPTSNVCAFSATGLVKATLKPWGSAQNPDCTGFTPAQLSMLDFGKMDLSAWFATIMGKVQAPDAENVVSTATTQAQNFYNEMQMGGTATTQAPVATQFAVITPTEALGPFTTKLTVAPYYPPSGTGADPHSDPVFQVGIDWGDCSLKDTADEEVQVPDPNNPATTTVQVMPPASQLVKGDVLEAFVATHTYTAPNQQACKAASATVNEDVKLTITSKSGIHYTDLQVINVWGTPSSNSVGLNESSGGNSGSSISAPLPPAQSAQ
jgi:hypothetical protein